MKCMKNYLNFIALNVRDGTESKYPSIVFLSKRIQSYNGTSFYIDNIFGRMHSIGQYVRLNESPYS